VASSPLVVLTLVGVLLQGSPPRRAATTPVYPYEIAPQDALWGHLSEGLFREPMAVCFEPTARELYVADSKNSRIGIFDEHGTPLFTFGGSALLLEPKSIEVDPDGTIYALDSASAELRRFSYRGEFETTLAFERPGKEGEPALQVAIATFAHRSGGNWVVLDRDRADVLLYDSERKFVRVLPPPPGFERLPSPSDVALSPEGLIAVCDQRADPALHVFDAEGRPVASFGGRDVALSDFTAPVSIAFDDEGFLYAVDMLRHDIKIYTTAGVFLQHFGGWFSPETRGRAPGEMLYPVDVCVAPAGGPVYVAERFGQRVQVFERKPRTTPPPVR
jgi:DNA-binding beta-propeller fold protein YncE